MIILGIETSCDETAAAVVRDGTQILSSVVSSSVQLHAQTGGIIPEIAAREQVKYIIPVVEEALRNGCGQIPPSPPIDAIAVTVGPGLIGSLLVGVETAKTLAYVWQKPIIPVNHLLGHVYANWLLDQKTEKGEQEMDSRKQKTEDRKISVIGLQSSNIIPQSVFSPPVFPLIALLVSGGHTDLILMKDHDKIRWLGGTRDDAAGECFDKCARLLGLGYPGGPAIAATAKQSTINHQQSTIKLPRPMINEANFDFSFSGLKTAVLHEVNLLKNNQQYNNLTIQQLSSEIQEAITDVLVAKTLKAAEKFKVKSILLAGGVAANLHLREKFKTNTPSHFSLHTPISQLCTDNAAYIASCAYFHYKPIPWQEITAKPGLTITGEG